MQIKRVETFFLKVPLDRTIRDSLFEVAYIGLPVVKLTTDDGLVGWGFNWMTAGGGEFAKEMIDRYMVKTIVGRDPMTRTNDKRIQGHGGKAVLKVAKSP